MESSGKNYENNSLLTSEERIKLSLRSLYKLYGYLPYKMSKFEEYDLYVRNKDFLVSNRFITFNDTDGKLLALKPDITLSIINNGTDEADCKQKVFYDEKVYRISESTGHFKELTQLGLECIGSVDAYDLYEVISLAACSLSMISNSYVLEISHLGILATLLQAACPDAGKQQKALRYIEQKNAHDLEQLCKNQSAAQEDIDALLLLVSSYGKREDVLNVLRKIPNVCNTEAFKELEQLSALLDGCEQSSNILFDFSVVNDMAYYNGLVFRGFIDGAFDSVLAGGQYDNLMQKMNRNSKAIGFAIYVDMLERLSGTAPQYDVDVLLLYGEDESASKIAELVGSYIASGKTVSAQKSIPAKLRYKELVDLTSKGGDAQC